jgi:hypothetical protein
MQPEAMTPAERKKAATAIAEKSGRLAAERGGTNRLGYGGRLLRPDARGGGASAFRFRAQY